MTLAASDKKSALMGFLVAALTILVVMYGMVQFTNAQFDSHEAHAATGAEGSE